MAKRDANCRVAGSFSCSHNRSICFSESGRSSEKWGSPLVRAMPCFLSCCRHRRSAARTVASSRVLSVTVSTNEMVFSLLMDRGGLCDECSHQRSTYGDKVPVDQLLKQAIKILHGRLRAGWRLKSKHVEACYQRLPIRRHRLAHRFRRARHRLGQSLGFKTVRDQSGHLPHYRAWFLFSL